MLLLTCPYCSVDDDFTGYFFHRENPKGVHFERWRYENGCCTGGFKVIPGSGWGMAGLMAKRHSPLTEEFGLNRFCEGRFIDESVAEAGGALMSATTIKETPNALYERITDTAKRMLQKANWGDTAKPFFRVFSFVIDPVDQKDSEDHGENCEYSEICHAIEMRTAGGVFNLGEQSGPNSYNAQIGIFRTDLGQIMELKP